MAKRQFSGSLTIIQADLVKEQLVELIEKLALRPEAERFFTICLKCNELLHDVPKEDVVGMVPAYVFETKNTFRICRRCTGVFWPGTHRDNVLQFLTTRILCHHPGFFRRHA